MELDLDNVSSLRSVATSGVVSKVSTLIGNRQDHYNAVERKLVARRGAGYSVCTPTPRRGSPRRSTNRPLMPDGRKS
jgi:hypothetical protein